MSPGQRSTVPCYYSPCPPTPSGSIATSGRIRFYPGPAPTDLPEVLRPLLWPGKVQAQQSYSGAVYMKRQPGDRFHLSIPIDDTTFEFDFTLPQAAAQELK